MSLFHSPVIPLLVLLMNLGPITWGMHMLVQHPNIQDRKILISCITLLLLLSILIIIMHTQFIKSSFRSWSVCIFSIIAMSLGLALVQKQKKLKIIGMWIIFTSLLNAAYVVSWNQPVVSSTHCTLRNDDSPETSPSEKTKPSSTMMRSGINNPKPTSGLAQRMNLLDVTPEQGVILTAKHEDALKRLDAARAKLPKNVSDTLTTYIQLCDYLRERNITY